MDTINENILKETKVSQWKNTSQEITWLKNINNKKATSFIKFGDENFYLSISIDLFTDTITYANTITSTDVFSYQQ